MDRDAPEGRRRRQSDRLSKLVPIRLDGEKWWIMAQVYEALGALRHRGDVDAAHKRWHLIFGKNYDSKRVRLIDRRGVEQLAIEYGHQPRHELMAALDRGGGDEDG